MKKLFVFISREKLSLGQYFCIFRIQDLRVIRLALNSTINWYALVLLSKFDSSNLDSLNI